MSASVVSDFSQRAEVERYRLARHKMVRRLKAAGLSDPRVLRSLAQIPRHLLVPEALRHRAYDDVPLPIGSGQTISAPHIVGLMSERLALTGDEQVLEVGTGSAYQCAVLSQLAMRVVSIERVPALANAARSALDCLGIINAVVHLGDGTRGRPQEGPYDAILVTASGPEIPRALVQQLKPGGRLIGPFGAREAQELVEITRDDNEAWTKRALGRCRFVDLVGEEGWSA